MHHHLHEIIDEQVQISAAHHIDAGVEATLFGPDFSGEVDFVVAVFREHREPVRRIGRLHQAVDRAIGKPVAETWPVLARPRLELHLGALASFDGERVGGHASIGSGIGPIGLGIGATLEHRDAYAFAVSPEIRIRHRVGPAERSPSFGAVVRTDVFTDGDVRVTAGVFGMFDAW